MKNTTVLLFLLVIGFSCDKIKSTNPFDPECPRNLFTPKNIQANQVATGVELTWSIENKNISGYKLRRKFDNGVDVTLATLSKDSLRFIDTSIQIGRLHSYSLVSFANLNESLTTSIDITPKFKVATAFPSSIKVTSAILTGNLTVSSNAIIKNIGFTYRLLNSSTVTTGSIQYSSPGVYNMQVDNLIPNSAYVFKAFATDNTNKVVYGNEISFTTKQYTAPIVSTGVIANITSSKADLSAIISDDGGAPVLESGIVYSIYSNPTISNFKVLNNLNAASFTSIITGLNPSTTYYARAFATNNQGTSYGGQVTFATTAKTLNTGSVVDIEGNVYKLVTIGTQLWMAENLKSTKYNDGQFITNTTDNIAWSNITNGSYSWYNNSVSNKSMYGALYNFYAVSTGKLCPVGWHVPSDDEWNLLISYLGGNDVAGGKMKNIGISNWITPNTGASNSSGFNGLPSGSRRFDAFYAYSIYKWLNSDGIWWSSSLIPSNNPNYNPVSSISLNSNSAKIFKNISEKNEGNAIRCIGN
jgi:uncharacterized protein (TIGR02145 family)